MAKKAARLLNGWTLKNKGDLTASVDAMIKTKSVGQSVMYGILLLLAMLAIFDTQVLSIFPKTERDRDIYCSWLYTPSGCGTFYS